MKKQAKYPARRVKQFSASIKFILSIVLILQLFFAPAFDRRAAANHSSLIKIPPAQLKNEPAARQSFADLPIYFEANHGQFDARARFVARAGGQTFFLTEQETVFVMPLAAAPESDSPNRTIGGEKNETENSRKMLALRMKFVGASAETAFSGVDEQAAKTNYFRGSDAAQWQTNVPTFARVRQENLYAGVDLEWHGSAANEFEYDFNVQPDADARQIEIEFAGAQKVEITGGGDLLIHTAAGTLTHRKPVSYQESNGTRREIESRYELRGETRIGFAVGDYDSSQKLVIDPTLVYSTFLGGGGRDLGLGIAVDTAGSVYVSGITASANFPTTAGVFDASQNGADDTFVTKLNADATALVYSTYLGGSANDVGNSISLVVDAFGSPYLTGQTFSIDFPVTAGAFDTSYNGGGDAFVTKLSASGSSLLYSTFLGASGNDYGLDLTVDAEGGVFVAGYTNSVDFPATANAFDTTFNGGTFDCFVANIKSNGTALGYSTYLGGNGDDIGDDVAVDASGSFYVAGNTGSGNFPTTGGAFDTTFNGGQHDAFVAKFSAVGLSYSTFLGGESDETGYDISVSPAGNVFINGNTASLNFPVTAGAFDTSYNGGIDAYIAKLNANGSALVYSTYVGGSGAERGLDLVIDAAENVYLAGQTYSTNFPVTPNAFDTSANGGSDAFLFTLKAGGTASLYSTYMGGSSFEEAFDVAVTATGGVYVTGTTDSANFPTTAGAFDTSHNGSSDVYVMKFDFSPTPTRFDFDGDGKADQTLFRPSDGVWYLFRSQAGYAAVQFGAAHDKLAPADFDGDGRTDIAVFRDGVWYWLKSSDGSFNALQFGASGDAPMPADYTGDGRAELAVYRAGFWYTLNLVDNQFHELQFGIATDKPVPADYDGDRKTDLAVYRDGTWYLLRSTQGFTAVQFGIATDKPTVGDYDGDGKADQAVYRAGEWFVLGSTQGFFAAQFGLASDIPVAADYDGDGKTDYAVYRGGIWYLLQTQQGFYKVHFGEANDKPVPAAYVP
jgi:hypothetical protein